LFRFTDCTYHLYAVTLHLRGCRPTTPAACRFTFFLYCLPNAHLPRLPFVLVCLPVLCILCVTSGYTTLHGCARCARRLYFRLARRCPHTCQPVRCAPACLGYPPRTCARSKHLLLYRRRTIFSTYPLYCTPLLVEFYACSVSSLPPDDCPIPLPIHLG